MMKSGYTRNTQASRNHQCTLTLRIKELYSWMTSNKLMLNADKTHLDRLASNR